MHPQVPKVVSGDKANITERSLSLAGRIINQECAHRKLNLLCAYYVDSKSLFNLQPRNALPENAAISMALSWKGPWHLARTLTTQKGDLEVPPSPPSSWGEDLHLQAVEHARHTCPCGAGCRPAAEIEGALAGWSNHILDGVSFSVFYFSAFGNHIVMDGK